mgnify:CR=1 FL=1
MHKRLRSHPLILAAMVLVAVGCNDATSVPVDAVGAAAVNFDIDAGSGTWITGTPMPLAKNNGATGVVNQKLFVAAAVNELQTDLQVFDPATGVWTVRTPTVGRARTMGGGISGKFYVAGGCVSSDCRIGTTSLLQAFDPATNTWSTKSPMPTARSFGASAVINNKLYVVGGQGTCAPCALQENLTPVLEVYDPVTNIWTSKAPMPGTRSFVYAAAVNGELYVVGTNDTPGGFVASLDVYNPESNSWSVRTPNATPRGWAGAAEVDGIIYALGGYTSPLAPAPSNTVEAYDPLTDEWVSVAPIPTGVLFPRPQGIGGALYVQGTAPNNTPSSLLQVFTPAPPPPLPPLDIPPTTAQVTAGHKHTCALKADATVLCWGQNLFGQATPPIGIGPIVQVSAGSSFNCALEAGGTVACWGANQNGQTVVPVGLTSVVQVSAGGSQTCVLKSDRSALCWGNNEFGKATVPAGLGPLAYISAGSHHTCALRANGTVACWGLNGSGQTNVPGGLSGVVQLSSGNFHTCVLKADQSVVCWGAQVVVAAGQATVPPGLGPVAHVASGDYHTCALKTDQTVQCWGAGNYGDETSVPPGLASVVQLGAGYFHTCALKDDGTVVCWGWNDAGQATVPAGFNVYPQDITAPVAVIGYAADANGTAIANASATLSNSIAFAFSATDSVGVTSVECSLDASPFVACSSPAQYAALAVGAHSFRVIATDAAGNTSAPATFTWTVVTAAQAVQNIATSIAGMGLPAPVANSLRAPLLNLNTNNVNAACGKLTAFSNQVTAKVQNGQLTAAQGNQLLADAAAISAKLGC